MCIGEGEQGTGVLWPHFVTYRVTSLISVPGADPELDFGGAFIVLFM